MYDFLNIVIVLILAQFAIYFCYVISIQLDKVIPNNYRPYVYLLIGCAALYQILKLIVKFGSKFYGVSVFYFWIVFLAGMLVLFVTEKKKIQRKNLSQRSRGISE